MTGTRPRCTRTTCGSGRSPGCAARWPRSSAPGSAAASSRPGRSSRARPVWQGNSATSRSRSTGCSATASRCLRATAASPVTRRAWPRSPASRTTCCRTGSPGTRATRSARCRSGWRLIFFFSSRRRHTRWRWRSSGSRRWRSGGCSPSRRTSSIPTRISSAAAWSRLRRTSATGSSPRCGRTPCCARNRPGSRRSPWCLTWTWPAPGGRPTPPATGSPARATGSSPPRCYPRSLCRGRAADYLSEHALVGAILLVLEDQPAHLEVELLRVRQVVDIGQGLVLPGGLQDELAVAEDPAHGGALEGHVRHLGERHHVHIAGEDARREHEPMGGDDEVGYRPLPDLHRQVEEEDSPQNPDNQDDGAVAVRDGAAQPAGDGQPDEDPEDGLDQDGGVLVDGDDLALVGKKEPVYRGRHRVGVRNQPHPSARP